MSPLDAFIIAVAILCFIFPGRKKPKPESKKDVLHTLDTNLFSDFRQRRKDADND